MFNGPILFFSALVSFSALILAIVACAGSTSNYNPINKIFVAQLDLTSIDADKVFSNSSSVSLPGYINVGLWSYCVANDKGSVTSCTSPNGIQQFNLKNMLLDTVEDNEATKVVDSVASVALPSSLQKDMVYYNNLVKCMFITLIIAICAIFLDLVVNIVRWVIHMRFINWVGRFLASIAFTSFIISAGTSTGTYVYIRHLLNQNYDDYGIKLKLGRIFFALLWAAVAGALINSFLWGIVRVNRKHYPGAPPTALEEKPLM
ncbi:PUN1 (YLR414C) [Zygosaccharomyces parabailii]|uniref:ZYBA0S11-02388g1_1 n=1 Tax=Zygosaccharomyces bailii (strain CLIB 213 / ATCC 58445 / CBS 680 / BCRC 21525 / NBRC 1098 / NCYC 1416 / NRRL Y-2227) TaxID=1333698 RepID=A0A8J2TAR8_ZYGB2|nr:PUN1 (YLR414C) [Zygosaccharomyces parabailii]CDF91417.1 ZYBA0S11-02388g1_1 [Zygosaccharomyces bailii CLIB 213]CDH17156.1 related to Protein PUN1 [Zygosaccharomyces bailii ISA1307]SJM86825.1 related to protein PUN1 [Zygosaccharomyces bailii]